MIPEWLPAVPIPGFDRPPVLLCVDDEPNILNTLSRLFRPTGWRLLTAPSGLEGLRVLESQSVDLVISDMRMPEMDGAQFLAEVRQRWPETVRVLLTGCTDMGSTINAINHGEIYRYIAKPWDDGDMLLLARGALERRGLERERARLERMMQHRIEYLATHDTLTALPNRGLFHARLEHAVAKAHDNAPLALLLIDLDNFKTVNDTLGHDIGDELLKAIADRLRDVVDDVDALARIGGDEFTVTIASCPREAAGRRASRIARDLSASFTVEAHKLFVSASVGVALYPDDGNRASDLIRAADAALFRAKEQGRNRVEFFTPDLHARLHQRVSLTNALREGIRQNRLRLVFQPKVTLSPDHSVVGAEALLRWHDPEFGEVSPAEFIPVAEANGLIIDLYHVTRRLLMSHMASWSGLGLPIPPIAFNVSPRCIHQPSFARQITGDIAATGLPNDRFQVEITESALLEDSDQVVANLQELAATGIAIAIDDFGTGYSSLSYLKKLPLTELKIDKSFVDGLGQDMEDEAIARVVLALANSLKLTAVAEGVETRQQADWLMKMGCDVAQGFHFFQPMEAEAFADLLRGNRTAYPTTRDTERSLQ